MRVHGLFVTPNFVVHTDAAFLLELRVESVDLFPNNTQVVKVLWKVADLNLCRFIRHVYLVTTLEPSDDGSDMPRMEWISEMTSKRKNLTTRQSFHIALLAEKRNILLFSHRPVSFGSTMVTQCEAGIHHFPSLKWSSSSKTTQKLPTKNNLKTVLLLFNNDTCQRISRIL